MPSRFLKKRPPAHLLFHLFYAAKIAILYIYIYIFIYTTINCYICSQVQYTCTAKQNPTVFHSPGDSQDPRIRRNWSQEMTPEIWEVPKLTPSPKKGLPFLSFTALKISSEEAFRNMFFLQKLKCICWLLESLETCVSPIPVINVSVEYVSFGKFQIRHYVKWPLWVFGCVWPSVDQQFKEKTIAERSGPFLRSEAKP